MVTQQLAPCGTPGALRRHKKKGETCEKCASAHVERLSSPRFERDEIVILPDNAGRDMRWRRRARCRTPDEDIRRMFDPPTVGRPRDTYEPAAELFCADCPVIQQCADVADRGYEQGLWGGSIRDQPRGTIPSYRVKPLIPTAPRWRVPREDVELFTGSDSRSELTA